MNIDDLKCCGNCLNRVTNDMGDCSSEGCEETDNITGSYEYCDEWEYDGLHRESRMEILNISKI